MAAEVRGGENRVTAACARPDGLKAACALPESPARGSGTSAAIRSGARKLPEVGEKPRRPQLVCVQSSGSFVGVRMTTGRLIRSKNRFWAGDPAARRTASRCCGGQDHAPANGNGSTAGCPPTASSYRRDGAVASWGARAAEHSRARRLVSALERPAPQGHRAIFPCWCLQR